MVISGLPKAQCSISAGHKPAPGPAVTTLTAGPPKRLELPGYGTVQHRTVLTRSIPLGMRAPCTAHDHDEHALERNIRAYQGMKEERICRPNNFILSLASRIIILSSLIVYWWIISFPILPWSTLLKPLANNEQLRIAYPPAAWPGPSPALCPDITKITRPSARIKYQCSVCPHGRSMRTFEKHVESGAHVQAVRQFMNKAQENEAYIQQHSTPQNTIQTPFQKAFKALGDTFEDDLADDEFDEEAIAADLAGVKAQDSLDWYPFKKKEHVLALLMIGNTQSILLRAQYQRIRAILRMIFNVKLPEWGVLRAVSTRMKEQLGMTLSERKSPWGTPIFGLNIKTIIRNELANPIVSPHIVFLPEISEGPINRLPRCRKWREEYSPDLLVQMIVLNQTHFYIYEPVQLWTKQLVVPIFFYQEKYRVKAKCLPALIEPDANNPAEYKPSFHMSRVLIRINSSPWSVNLSGKLLGKLKWQAQAAGKVIRHVPISLYSDDTSGNVSKKWNKHMSLYFTLSGLPPSMSNQEYNIHFLGTSNVGNALELLDQVVDDVNELGQEGFITYDHTLGEDVLAMVVVLFHLGDSPMHAEVSDTLNPANTLSPCRMCYLQAAKMADKESSQFVHDFGGINHDGLKVIPPLCNWSHTVQRSRELWLVGQKHHTKTLYEDMVRHYGLRDIVNNHFVKQLQIAHNKLTPNEVQSVVQQLEQEYGNRIFNPMLRLKGFDGHQDTPVEILHVVLLGITKCLFRDAMKDVGNTKIGLNNYNYLSAQWRSFSSKGLNIPPIQPNNLITYYNSLVGKDFRTVLQSVPFVLFDFILPEKRHVWTLLCVLSSYIFQTTIPDMKQYLCELEIHITWFLKQLIALTAQWVTKPKFHMLVHLRQSIHRFGPACLFAMEKSKSFNGVLRNTSIHSNHLSPGRDIAKSFNTAQMLRMLISGSSFFDKELQERVVAGPLLRNLFKEVPELVAAIGLNPFGDMSKTYSLGARAKNQSPPPVNFNHVDNRTFQEYKSVTLPSGERVEPQDFVMLKGSNTVVQVMSIWNADCGSADRTVLVLKKCEQGRMIPFYGMREILVTKPLLGQSVKAVECLLNIQHDCHEGGCTISKSHMQRVERNILSTSVYAMNHQLTNSFIINSASQYSSELHRKLSNFQYSKVTPADWKRVISEGLKIWHETPFRAPKKKKGQSNDERL
ncbi:hypothetical protein DFH28DRAFT_1115281 [Melampsora americana]|nr:hypothetical protein DFH28DRAFT_1115281 [Melampsora americana]